MELEEETLRVELDELDEELQISKSVRAHKHVAPAITQASAADISESEDEFFV